MDRIRCYVCGAESYYVASYYVAGTKIVCSTCFQKLEARVKELEGILESIKQDPSIGKLEVKDGWEDYG